MKKEKLTRKTAEKLAKGIVEYVLEMREAMTKKELIDFLASIFEEWFGGRNERTKN